jgi:predicted O-methyltransferase YrrM
MRTIDDLLRTRERLFRDGTVVAQKDGRSREVFPVAIGEREGQSLLEWVLQERATRTLETGLGFAISTLFICEGLLPNGSDGRHVACDPYQFDGLPTHRSTYAGVGIQILEEAGVRDLVEFHPEGSEIVLPRLLEEGRRFDLAFLDGNHRFEGVLLDLIYVGRLLKEGGAVFVDDAHLPGVDKAINFCQKNLGWTSEARGDDNSHGWIVLRTGGYEVYGRPFVDFVDF